MTTLRLRIPSSSDFAEDLKRTSPPVGKGKQTREVKRMTMEARKGLPEAWSPSEELKPYVPEKVPTWNQFTQQTTIHGVRYIFDASSNRFRRIFWICICVSALIYFMVQLAKSVIKYYEYGTATDVKITYKDSVLFPAVTLCNQNNFRMTAAADYDLYDYIDAIFSKSKEFDASDYRWENVNITDFVNKTAHQMEDFIEGCTWNAWDCNLASDFAPIFTAFGVCYTFNGGSQPRYATEPGSSAGLSLVLNVEQYEYMRGPNSDAGIKVLLHDPKEKPEMSDQGFVVAPGTHTLVNVQLKQVAYMPPPWGTCNETAEPYHMCIADCRNIKAAKRCGCRDVYMSGLSAGPDRFCNMNESLVCMRRVLGKIRQENSNCHCNSTCSRTLFEPSLSYAMLSEFNIDQVALTTNKRKRSVQSKFELAMETQQRCVKRINAADATIMNRVVHLANNLKTALDKTFLNFENTTKLAESYKMPDVLNEELANPRADIDFARERIKEIKFRKESITFNFWPVRTLMLQVIQQLMSYHDGYSWAMYQIGDCISWGFDGSENSVDYCAPPPGPDKTECDFYMENLCSVINHGAFVLSLFQNPTQDVIINTARRQLVNLEDYNAVINWTFAGKPLIRTKFPDHGKCQRNLKLYENKVLPSIEGFLKHLEDIYYTENLTETLQLFQAFEWSIDNELGPYLFVNDSVERWALPENVHEIKEQEEYEMNRLKCSWFTELYDDELNELGSYLTNLYGTVSTKHNKIKNLFSIVAGFVETMMSHYNENLEEVIQKITDYTEERTTKKELAVLLSDPSFSRAIVKLSTINNNLITAIRNFETSFRTFPSLLMDFYEGLREKTFPLLTDQTKDNYPFLKQMMTWYNDFGGKELIDTRLQLKQKLNGVKLPESTIFTETNIWIALKKAIEGFNENTGLEAFVVAMRDEITTPVTSLIGEIDNMVVEMQDYKKKITMNTYFYMKNFVQLDIFYNELSYIIVKQQPAFDLGGFLGEVGGFLGLLLGASIVTVCELLDYIVLNCVARCRRRKKTDVDSFSSNTDLSS